MTTQTQRKLDAALHTAQLVALLGYSDTETIQRLASSLHRLSVATCNGYQDEAAAKRADARTDRLEARAVAIAQRHGLNLYVQGDPRGAPLYLWRDEDLDAYRERIPSLALTIKGLYNAIGVAVY